MKILIFISLLLISNSSFSMNASKADAMDKQFFCNEIAQFINGSTGGAGHPTPPLMVNMLKCLSNQTMQIERISSNISFISGEVAIDPLGSEPYFLKSLFCTLSYSGKAPFAVSLNDLQCQQ